jgi:hypothetical protein
MYTAPELIIGAKLAYSRLHNRVNGKLKPLCLACGEPATNDLPSCNEKKCVRTVRPVYRWAKHVVGLTTTKAVKIAARKG